MTGGMRMRGGFSRNNYKVSRFHCQLGGFVGNVGVPRVCGDHSGFRVNAELAMSSSL